MWLVNMTPLSYLMLSESAVIQSRLCVLSLGLYFSIHKSIFYTACPLRVGGLVLFLSVFILFTSSPGLNLNDLLYTF